MTVLKTLLSRPLLACAMGAALAMPAQAAVYHCSIPKIRGNEFVCREYPNLCNFIFIVDVANKKMSRKNEDNKSMIRIVADKWEDNLIIAHEDQNRIDSRYLEQYFYKIEPATGNFMMANEYVTSKGRYLTKEDIALADPRTFSYYKPRLFSEKGSCKYKAKE